MKKRGIAHLLLIVVIVVALVGGVGIFAATNTPELSPSSLSKSSSGKGSLGAPNTTHLACVGLSCQIVSGGGPNTCATNNDCRHLACVGSSCTFVAGGGPNLCNSNLDCAPVNASVCGNGIVEAGEQCEFGFQCGGGQVCQNCQCVTNTTLTHLACVGQQCVSVTGAGPNLCTSSAQCLNTTNITLPDLAILDLDYVVSTNSSNVSLSALVRNIGTGSAGASTTRFSLGAQLLNRPTPALSSGQQTIVSAVFNANPGTYIGDAFADILFEVAESNENNNDAPNVTIVVT